MLNQLDQLVNTIHLKKKNGGTYILLLGGGCSVSSNCPSAKELTKKIIKDNKLELDLNKTTLEDIESHLGRTIFNLNLKEYFANSKPSKGYWFLAELIKKGYFDLVLTTNYDTCLEKTLGKIVDYDEFRVCIRGDIDDDRINELIDLPPRIKIIKLHGDYQSRNMKVKPEELWELKSPLKNTLSNIIEKRGIIIIGYSMHDSSILGTLPKDTAENYWYVDVNPPDSITKSNLKHTLIKGNHIISGDEGDFDKFFSELAEKLGEKDEDIKKNLYALFNNNRENINERSKFEIEPYRLISHIDILSTRRINRDKIESLVFIHDPEVPGGTEVLRLIKRRHPEVIKDRNIFKIQIEGRGEIERKVTRFELIQEPIPPASQMYLLIDSVSFTGGTLEKCRDYLITQKSAEKVEAAVIYSGTEQEKKLLKEDYCFRELFFKVEVVTTHHLLFPWGWTFATEPIKANELQPNTIDEYIPHKYFSFLPRPWGNILSMRENEQMSVKILYLKPHEMTSKHRHFVRNEIFLVLDEKLILQVWDEHILLRRGSSFRVPAGTEHRLIGLDEPCRVLEISQGYHNQVEDIKRLEDKYGREKKKGDV